MTDALHDKNKKHWKKNVILTFIPPGRFEKGSRSVSARFRAAQRQAVLQYAQQAALNEPVDANDQLVATRCADAVASRWNSKHPDVLKTVVHTVALRVRRRRREGCPIESDDLLGVLDTGLKQQFESDELMEVVMSSSATNPAADGATEQAMGRLMERMDGLFELFQRGANISPQQLAIDHLKAEAELIQAKQAVEQGPVSLTAPCPQN